MNFLKLRSMPCITGYLGTLATQKESQLATRHFWKKRSALTEEETWENHSPPQAPRLLSFVLYIREATICPPHTPGIISKYCEAETTSLGKRVSGTQDRWACDLKSKRPGFESMHCHVETIRSWAGNLSPPGNNKTFLFPGIILRID